MMKKEPNNLCSRSSELSETHVLNLLVLIPFLLRIFSKLAVININTDV